MDLRLSTTQANHTVTIGPGPTDRTITSPSEQPPGDVADKRLLVLAAPGSGADQFVDALTRGSRLRGPVRPGLGGARAMAAARATGQVPTFLRHWDGVAPGSVGELLDRLGRPRVVVLTRADQRVGALVEHRAEVALANRRARPCDVSDEELDWDRVRHLHDWAHEELPAWLAEVDERRLAALVLRQEDWVDDLDHQVGMVQRWLGLEPEPAGSPTRPSLCQACERAVAGLRRRLDAIFGVCGRCVPA